ncbi:hypothetical protein ACKFKG_15875 [Phormidesmis sp. 146-35]
MPNHAIRRQTVRLQFLPDPDRLDFALPKDQICLLTDEGSPMTMKVAKSLIQQGWKVVVLSFPHALVTKPTIAEGINRVVMDGWSEDQLKWQLNTIADTYGPIGAFIHLNPSLEDYQNAGIQAPEVDKAIVQQVFLIAKHLKKSLTQPRSVGRACFLTVARLDGAFGLSQRLKFSAISAGLFGLTKTLNAEWESVFCRAIDLSPRLDFGQSAQCILAELHDPDRGIAEVAYGEQGRATLIAEVSTMS